MQQRHARHTRPWKHKIGLDDRILKFLLTLYDHNTLSTDFLHELVCPDMSMKTTLRDLDLMHAEPNAWIDAPDSQWNYRNSYKRNMFYSINDKGQHVLSEQGLIPFKKHKPPFHFPHQAMQDQFLALIKLGANDNYIPRHEILAHAPEKTRKSKNPLSIETGPVPLIPDALFGLFYPDRDKPYSFFLVEIDRGTIQLAKPKKPAKIRSKTWEENVAHYDTLYANRTFQNHFGIYESPISLLVITVSENRMYNMMEYWKNGVGKSRLGIAAFQTIPNIGSINEPIKPTDEFFKKPFYRVNDPPLYLTNGAANGSPTPPKTLWSRFTRP